MLPALVPVIGGATGFIALLVTAFFGPDIIRKYQSVIGGGDKPITEAQLNAALAQMAQVPQTRVPTTPGAPSSEPEPEPTTKEIVAQAVDKPINWLFLALLAFALVFVIAQLRAATHEGISYAGDALDGAKSATRSLADADGSTRNISRRAKS